MRRPALALLLLPPLAPGLAAQDEARGLVVTNSGIESLTLGGELRARTEAKDPGAPASNAGGYHQNSIRARLSADAKVDEYLRAFVQLQHAVMTAGDASATDLHQGYLHLDQLLGDYELQLGRFEQMYGEGRMVAPDDWRVRPNAFDGVLGRGQYRNLQLNLFLTEAVSGQGARNSRTDFYGVYGVWDWDDFLLDTYVLRKNSPSGPDRDIKAYGVRAHGTAFERLDWSAEAILEDGRDIGNRDLYAQGYVLNFAYALDGGHHVGLEWSYATGDDTPGNGEVETFRPLFMDTHTWNGIADVVTWSNLIDLAARYWLDWNERWSFHAELHHFSKQAEEDAIYPIPGGPAIASTGSGNIGAELDLYAIGNLTENVYVGAGAAYFAAGGAIADSEDLLYGYLQIGIRF